MKLREFTNGKETGSAKDDDNGKLGEEITLQHKIKARLQKSVGNVQFETLKI